MEQQPLQDEFNRRARQVKLLALDVDGVLTDGLLYFSNQGDELKAFNIFDGHGIKMLQDSGVRVALITGRESRIVAHRAGELGITLVYQNQGDKLKTLDAILADLQLDYQRTAYMGDDLPDLACIRRAGLGLTVPNAHPAVIEHAVRVTSLPGGKGAVREVCEWILQAQGRYQALIEGYL